jgi:aromatic-L-amino-acid/L-tryptophan decarboxylase
VDDRLLHDRAADFSVAMTGDFGRDEVLANGRAVLDWIADYLDEPERYPVLSRARPGEIRAKLPPSPPVHGEPFADILRDFETTIVPGLTHWNHPGFFAYFATSAAAPGILAEMLAAALDVKVMLWKASPAGTELEQVVTDWLRQMLGLGDGWFGITTDTASISTMLALAAAREAKPELAIRARGMAGRADLPALRVYASEHAHSSIDKGVIALGFGLENLVRVPSDSEFRMRPDLLAGAIAADRERGFLPLACVATVGTTSAASVDPLAAVAEICERENVWLHVDGAYGGMLAVAPEFRSLLDGVEGADSLVVNPHKWLFTPSECSVLYVKQPEVLKRAFSLVPEYLVTREQESVVNYMDYGVQLGRRFRALKLWMIIRAFGVDGLAARIRAHRALALEFAEWVRATPDWEVVAPVDFSLVCFRFAPKGVSDQKRDEMNEAVMHAVNESGVAFLSHTKLGGRLVLRLAIGNIRTEKKHVASAWNALKSEADKRRE